jgi:hypothetical protein
VATRDVTLGTASPAHVSEFADPGDEVQRRFRYQINYSALKALQLLATEVSMQAVYCEQVEDLLVERLDGKFIGIQIKTRELNQGPFKSGDAPIVAALCRFCIRDAFFPGWFALFILATNFVFYQGKGPDDLRKILNCVQNNRKLAGLGARDKIRKYLEQLASRTALSVEAVIETLTKVALEERKTGIDQPELELVHALGQIDAYAHLRMDQLMRGAQLLRARLWDASSLSVEGVTFESHDVTADFNAHIGRLRVAQKRVDAAVLTDLLGPAASADTTEELLAISDYLVREAIPPGLGRMELKMAAGAISYADIDQMKDDVASLDSTFLRWKERYGLPEANRRLAHFQYFASRDARAAQSRERRAGVPYGQAMLDRFRTHAASTHATEKAALFGCRPEHLVGAAGLLTDECRIWWGEPVATEQGQWPPCLKL